MAATGVILFGWIFLHMLGNVKLYLHDHENAKGVMAPAMDHYAVGLRELGAPIAPEGALLWFTRILLLVCVVFHIHSAYALTRKNREARPVGYRDRGFVKASYASRTMRWGGVILLLFIIYHVLHLTTGHAHPAFEAGKVKQNVVVGLDVWWVSAIYIIANLALGLHLYHGLWAMFSSLGLTNPRFEGLRRHFATAFAVLITAGNVSFPLAVLARVVRLD
ncbi:MAG TPA: succinate dehydrogenase cytochrome b subunit [Thermoanaerobaculia bacterium]